MFGVYIIFYSNLNMFLLLYVAYYIVNRSYLYYVSIFIILLFYNEFYLLSYILPGPILYIHRFLC